MIREFLFFVFVCLHIHVTLAEEVECLEINDWDSLRQVIFKANNHPKNTHRYGSYDQAHILLCPFEITKEFDEHTNHWLSFIKILKPMHIQCHKTRDIDVCSVNIVGPQCFNGDNCGRRLFKIESDNVWIEGITIKSAEDNIFFISDDRKNIKLIDIKVLNSRVPTDKTAHTSSGLIMTSRNSNVQMIDCYFGENKSTVLTNKGDLLLINSQFKNNEGTEIIKNRSKAGAVYNHGSLTIAGNKFDDNKAAKGPAIYSKKSKDVYDAGGNCASNNAGKVDSCDGIWWKEDEKCEKFVGPLCTS